MNFIFSCNGHGTTGSFLCSFVFLCETDKNFLQSFKQLIRRNMKENKKFEMGSPSHGGIVASELT